MATREQIKGSLWELEVARYLNAERRRNHQSKDLGDIVGLRGTVVECKAQRAYQLQEWNKELQREVNNAQADLGLLAIKTKGKTSAREGLWLMDSRSVPYIIALVERNWILQEVNHD